jgi:sialate O-acetylesterase
MLAVEGGARASASAQCPSMQPTAPALRSLAVVTATLLAAAAPAQLRLHNAFSSHMVLQREQPLRILGTAAPGERVDVTFGSLTAMTTADAGGKWIVELPAQKASAEPRTLLVRGDRSDATEQLDDVVIGDVWLCSGQSNMAWSLGGCDDRSAIEAAEMPIVRYRPYFERFAGELQDDLQERSEWRVMGKQNAADCTAVGFYFARALRRETDVPIGLLTCAVGGTEIECWMPPGAFSRHEGNRAIGEERARRIEAWQRELASMLPKVEAWTAEAKSAAQRGERIPDPPRLPLHPNEDRSNWHRTQSLYNGMVHPLTAMPIRGVLWYQGESNQHEDFAYARKLTAMVEEWRAQWRIEMPFYQVQLPFFGRAMHTEDAAKTGDLGFAPCRMAQLRCLSLPHSGMAVALDLGDKDDIHPRNKREIGERLARWALRDVHGKDVDPSGPLFAACAREGDSMRIMFTHADEGLRVAGDVDTTSVQGFAIAGKDRVFHRANATIEGATVLVSCADVQEPVAVRYAYAGNPIGCDLVDRGGLPASPFRSDDW